MERRYTMPDLSSLLKSGIVGAAILVLSGCAGTEAPPPTATPPAQQQPPIATPESTQPNPAPPAAPQFGAKIGLLLPLSGKNADLGRNLHQAAELGLFNMANDNVALMVENTAPPADPESATRSLLAHGANILIGPLFSADLKRAAPIADRAHVPLLALSNDLSLAASGTYVLGLSPATEIERVIDYALSQGLERIALLAPNSPYGSLVAASANAALAKQGKALVTTTLYDVAAGDYAAAAKTIGAFNDKAGFGALLIAEGGEKLRRIAPLLIDAGIDPHRIRLLGTGLWQNDPGLSKEPGLSGAWYPAIPTEKSMAFAQRYRQAFGMDPDPRALFVYDAMALAIKLALLPTGRDFSSTSLADPKGFTGAEGLFRLTPDGKSERGLAIMELGASGPTLRDPAPTQFSLATN